MQDVVARRHRLEQELWAENAFVQQLENDRVRTQSDYLHVSRTAILEQGWRMTTGLIAAATAETGTEVTIPTNHSLPPGCSYDWSEWTLIVTSMHFYVNKHSTNLVRVNDDDFVFFSLSVFLLKF
jgi:hypothetical protein